ncbi:MAG: YybH family protein [Flavisolibacter sp.]
MKYYSYLLLINIFILFANCSTTKESANNFAKDSDAIIASMNQSALDWNAGKLDAFMSLYDTASTFMMPNGPVGISGMKDNYQKSFFDGSTPKQNLRYEELVVRPLGNNYALLTGKFILYGNELKERTGRYSLVFVKRKEGWKILHDHSG